MEQYQVEIDAVTPEQWSSLCTQFDDANIFQSWHYGDTMYGSHHLTHVVVRCDGQVVAAVQGRIVKFPLLNSGIAHFLWGPMWKPRGRKPESKDLQQIIRAIVRQYAVDKGLLVRIRSYEILSEELTDPITTIFEKEGCKQSSQPHYTTMRIDLSPPMEHLRNKFSKSWKRHLRAAEKNNYTIIQGTDDAQFKKFTDVYYEMRARKKIVGYNPEISKYHAMQRSLPEVSKMVVITCEKEDETIAANVVSSMGNTGMYLFGCTSNRAVEENLRGSYLLHWWTMGWLKKHGFRWYDLKGYDPLEYPGVSRFKAGTRGQIVEFLEFSTCISKASMATVQCGEGLVRLAREIRFKIKRLRNWVEG